MTSSNLGVIGLHRFTCPGCGASVSLADDRLRVPTRAGSRDGSLRERIEYRCRRCGAHAILRMSRTGVAICLIVAVGVIATWILGVHRGAIAAGAIAVLMPVFASTRRLRPAEDFRH